MRRHPLQCSRCRLGALVFSLLLVADAQGQIALPPLPLPEVRIDRPIEVAVDTNQAAADVTSRTDLNRLRDLRRLRIRELLRTQRAVLEAGPRGMPIVRSEVVAFSPDDDALETAQAAGFSIVRERTLASLDTRIVILEAPAGWSTQRALRRLRALDPDGIYDLNHVYLESGALTENSVAPSGAENTGERSTGIRVGLIDAGIETSHPVFTQSKIHRHGCGDEVFPSEHGTAVASLLVGSAEVFRGAAPGADLYAADVYCGSPAGGAVDAVADAFGWLVRERVAVINVSLVGPANVVLENVVRLVVARGHLIVAAVGNDGPSAAALYPASYPGVIGVTAVDERGRALLEAARGRQVDFAAPGADMVAAAAGPSFAAVRGTSFAAPIVAGLLARSMTAPDGQAGELALNQLMSEAVDLGSRGPDRIYGNGLVGQDVRVTPRMAGLQ